MQTWILFCCLFGSDRCEGAELQVCATAREPLAAPCRPSLSCKVLAVHPIPQIRLCIFLMGRLKAWYCLAIGHRSCADAWHPKQCSCQVQRISWSIITINDVEVMNTLLTSMLHWEVSYVCFFSMLACVRHYLFLAKLEALELTISCYSLVDFGWQGITRVWSSADLKAHSYHTQHL